MNKAKVRGIPIWAEVMPILDQLKRLRGIALQRPPRLFWDGERKLRAYCPDCGDPLPFSQGPDAHAVHIGDTFYCKCKSKGKWRKDADKT